MERFDPENLEGGGDIASYSASESSSSLVFYKGFFQGMFIKFQNIKSKRDCTAGRQ
jgi:hypothetical protein